MSYEDEDGPDFADPGGRSALRARTYAENSMWPRWKSLAVATPPISPSFDKQHRRRTWNSSRGEDPLRLSAGYVASAATLRFCI